MLRELTPSQLGELLAFESMEPGGALRDDLRAAHIAGIYAAAYLKRKGGSGLKLQDFMLDFDPVDPMDHRALSRQIRAMLGGPGLSAANKRKK